MDHYHLPSSEETVNEELPGADGDGGRLVGHYGRRIDAQKEKGSSSLYPGSPC